MASAEQAFIDLLRGIVTDPAARELRDDAAVWIPPAGCALVLTHDMLVEGVHFIGDEPPGDIAWKLVAVNLSDLAAKGARPAGMLLGYMLGPDRDWDAAFVAGLGEAASRFGVPLLGGDTVAAPAGAARSFGLTAIGTVANGAPARSGAEPGHELWVTGTIGDAGVGLSLARAGATEPAALLAAYRRPMPRSAEGPALVGHASASADVSDGLLIDARRMAEASGCAVEIDLGQVPLSEALMAFAGEDRAVRLAAATAGDDYEMLLAVPPERGEAVAQAARLRITRVGQFCVGAGLSLRDGNAVVQVPQHLGYQH
jgi:thiamine-monophosphate kinase